MKQTHTIINLKSNNDLTFFQINYALFLLVNKLLNMYPFLFFAYMILALMYNLDSYFNFNFNYLSRTFLNNYFVIMEGSSDNFGSSDLASYNLGLNFNYLSQTFLNNYLVIMEGSSDNPKSSDLALFNLEFFFDNLSQTFLNNHLVIMEGSSDNPGSSGLAGDTSVGGHGEPGGSKDPQQSKNEHASGVKRKHEGDDSPDNRKRVSKSSIAMSEFEPCSCCSSNGCSCGGPQLPFERMTINSETSIRNKCFDIDRSAGTWSQDAPCCKCGVKYINFLCSRCHCSYCRGCHANHSPW